MFTHVEAVTQLYVPGTREAVKGILTVDGAANTITIVAIDHKAAEALLHVMQTNELLAARLEFVMSPIGE